MITTRTVLVRSFAYLSAAALPLLALADTTVTGAVDSSGNFFLGICFGNCSSVYGPGIAGFFGIILAIINNILVPLLFAIAFIVFLYGVFKYFIAGGGEAENHKDGAQFVLYGIIGFAIMLSVWGLVNVVTNTFGLAGSAHPAYPTL